MSSKIKIAGIKSRGKHGVLPEEKTAEQLFIVDVELKLDLEDAAKKDDLEKTVNYDEVARKADQIIKGPTVNLIETLATRIGTAILEEFERVEKVKVTVHKPNAPISVPFGDVSVTIKLER